MRILSSWPSARHPDLYQACTAPRLAGSLGADRGGGLRLVCNSRPSACTRSRAATSATSLLERGTRRSGGL